MAKRAAETAQSSELFLFLDIINGHDPGTSSDESFASVLIRRLLESQCTRALGPLFISDFSQMQLKKDRLRRGHI